MNMLPRLITKDSQLRIFQYKLLGKKRFLDKIIFELHLSASSAKWKMKHRFTSFMIAQKQSLSGTYEGIYGQQYCISGF